MADGRRIIQVLNNLLSNAARHSHEAVCHRGIGRAGGRTTWPVSVTDDGQRA